MALLIKNNNKLWGFMSQNCTLDYEGCQGRGLRINSDNLGLFRETLKENIIQS